MADDRAGEIRERVSPLLDMFRVAPAGRLGLDVEIRTFSEGEHIVVCNTRGNLSGTFIGQGVDTLQSFLPFSGR
jgi:hypothetical protein